MLVMFNITLELQQITTVKLIFCSDTLKKKLQLIITPLNILVISLTLFHKFRNYDPGK